MKLISGKRTRRLFGFEAFECRRMMAGDLAGAFGDRSALVADLNQAFTSFSVVEDVEFQGETYIIAKTEQSNELWKTDGTSDGTHRMFQGARFAQLTVSGDRLFFVADSAQSVEIWSIDGTAESLQTKHIVNKEGSINDNQNMNYNGLVGIQYYLFDVNDVLFAAASWLDPIYEDFAAPTVRLYSNTSGELQSYHTINEEFNAIARSGDEFYLDVGNNFIGVPFVLRTNPSAKETELVGWRRDPDVPIVVTESPDRVSGEWNQDTVLRLFGAELQTESTKFSPSNGHRWAVDELVKTNHGVVFQTRTKGDLLGSDGTPNGTQTLVSALHSTARIDFLGVDSYYALDKDRQLQRFETLPGNSLLLAGNRFGSTFTAPPPETVISTNGTSTGTAQISIAEDSDVLIPIGKLGDIELYMEKCSTSGSAGFLWSVVDGQLGEQLPSFCPRHERIEVSIHNERAWIASVDDSSGNLWFTDGTAAGTQRLTGSFPNEFPMPVTRTRAFSNVAFVGETAYFFGSKNTLYQSDGTREGTLPVSSQAEFGNIRSNVVSVDGERLLFMDDQSRLWLTDTTPQGTTLLKNFDGETFIDFQWQITEFDGTFFFTADDAEHGVELWSTDGTVEGTKLAVDINPGSDSSDPWNLVLIEEQLYFTANDGFHGEELWKVDLLEPVEHLVGDANGDRVVNFTDFLILSQNFGKETNEGVRDGDFDEDGKVTFADFLVLSRAFGTGD